MISDWAQKFGISIEPATGNPGETVYRVKDIFTTRDGSWEPSDKPGSVPQWARDAYLKPANHYDPTMNEKPVTVINIDPSWLDKEGDTYRFNQQAVTSIGFMIVMNQGKG